MKDTHDNPKPRATARPSPFLGWIKPESIATIKRLLSYIRPHTSVVLWCVLATILHAAADTVLPFLIAEVIERLEDAGRSGANAWQIPLLIAIVFPFRGSMDFLAVYGLNRTGRAVIREWRRELFEHYLALPAGFYDKVPSAHLLSKLTYDTEMVGEAVSGSVVVAVRDTLTILFLFAVMLYFSLPLTVLVLVMAPILGFLVRAMTRAFRRYGTRIQSSMGDVTRVTEESLLGQLVVKIFEGQDREQARFDAVNRNNFRLNTRIVAVRAFGDSVTQFVVALGVAAVSYAAFSDLIPIGLEAPQFVGFLFAMGLIFAPLRRLTNVNAVIQRGMAATESVFEMLDQPVEDEDLGEPLDRATGRIEYRHVSFSYDDGAPVLSDIDIDIPAGSSLALVGQSGSGKSTFVNLLPRFYSPTAGSILLDGKAISSYKLRDLRRQLSLVSQDTVLFDDSIANNIAYGGLGRSTRAAVERAADAAFVTEFAAELPDGLDSRVGERGALLSGGQRQRIAIARALLKDAPVLILDEATSALDSESERRIQAALDRLMRDRTTLIVAHRLSTVEKADRIAVLQDGRIVETGPHAELMRRGGYYANIYRMQFAGQ